MGQALGGIHLVETVADVATLEVIDPQRLAYVTQTTLSVDDCTSIVAALRKRFPTIAEPKKGDICYATQNRQDAVKQMAPQCDLVLVVGSPSSSNSNRLREVAQNLGCRSVVDRQCRRTRCRSRPWAAPHRGDCRGIRSGGVGRATRVAASRTGCRRSADARWIGGTCALPPAKRAW